MVIERQQQVGKWGHDEFYFLDIHDYICSLIIFSRVAKMSEYTWCHGPKCHERPTTTRVRGVKGSKVLRTKKIPINNWNTNCTWEYFCDQTCLHDFINKHYLEMVRMFPSHDPLSIFFIVVSTRFPQYGLSTVSLVTSIGVSRASVLGYILTISR